MRKEGVVLIIAGAVIAAIMWLVPVQTTLIGREWTCPGVPLDVLFAADGPSLGAGSAEHDYYTGCDTGKTRRLTIGTAIGGIIALAGCALIASGRTRPEVG